MKLVQYKNILQEWFEREIAELIHTCKNLFLKLKKSRLHIDEENYRKVNNQVQNFITKKKREFYEISLRQKLLVKIARVSASCSNKFFVI